MVTTIIIAALALAGVGIVIDQLFRLKKWLAKPPPGHEPGEAHHDPRD